jgi:hypothetical protein
MVFSDIGAVAETPTYGTTVITSIANLADGELCVCNDENLALSAANVTAATMNARVALTGVKIVGRYGSRLVHSDMFKCSDIITYRTIATSAAAEQVTHIGYTGTGGGLQVINDNIYKVKVQFWEEGRTGQGLNDFVSVYYKSDATATGTEIAFGLEELLRLSFNKQAERPVELEVLNSAAVVAGNALDENITVVEGSKFITSAVDYDYAAGTDLAVGDFLRIGTVNGGTALTDPVYRVVALTSVTVTELDRPVTNASGLYATATDDIEVIPAANIINAGYGLQLTGIARTHIVGKRPYSKVKFTVGLENFGTTATTYTTNMALGNGLEWELWDLEYFTEGNSGYKYRGDYMYNPAYTSRVLTGHTYDQWAITWASNSRAESIGGPGHNPKQLIVAADTLYLTTEPADSFFTVLDAYLINVGLPASGFNI